MNSLLYPSERRSVAIWRRLRRFRRPVNLIFILVVFPTLALAQAGGSPFDTGFTALQTLFTGTVAKVASLIAIVLGGYEFAHGEPGANETSSNNSYPTWSRQRLQECA